MPRPKKKKHRRYDSVLGEQKRQRVMARRLGYENVEKYEKGLIVIKQLLTNKAKHFDPENSPDAKKG